RIVAFAGARSVRADQQRCSHAENQTHRGFAPITSSRFSLLCLKVVQCSLCPFPGYAPHRASLVNTRKQICVLYRRDVRSSFKKGGIWISSCPRGPRVAEEAAGVLRAGSAASTPQLAGSCRA